MPRTTATRGASADDAPLVRVRILLGSTVAIGPGKADLLAAIAETGSISAAARRMRMSYRRAWLLVQTMNECFAEPLVAAAKGGASGGGASLTETGWSVLARYRDTARAATAAFAPYIKRKSRRRV
jgi:molybdate transport system regulatory protein